MYVSDEGLMEIEKVADKKRNAEVLLLVQILREIRQLAFLLNKETGFAAVATDETKGNEVERNG